MKNMHGATGPHNRKVACIVCRIQKSRCEGGPPCSECLRRGIQCSSSHGAEIQQRISHVSSPTVSLPAMSHGPSTQSNGSHSGEKSRYVDLYFKSFHPYWPFIHQSSFRQYDEAPLLIQSINVIGLWLSKEDNAQSRAISLHDVLGSAIHDQTVCDRTT